MPKYFLLIFLSATSLPLLSRAEPSNGSISGTITEKKSGEVIIGASVLLAKDSFSIKQGNVRGAVTNKFGFYSLPNVVPGSYVLSVRMIGYRREIFPILIGEGSSIRKDFQLDAEDIRGKEVTVQAEKNPEPTTKLSIIEVKPQFIQQLPAFGGEVDIFRALQYLPGVKAVNELSSGLYVRGGSPDQNLTLLDGVIVYNPAHLGGFLSTFNSDAVKDIKLIKGAFPAEYGGRLSSVLDMTMREGTKEKITGTAGISLINSRLTLEGPINDNATFMVSARRMYLDLIFLGIMAASDIKKKDLPTYYFYDLNGKVNYKLSESDRVYASGFFGRDVFAVSPGNSGTTTDVRWGNATINLRWTHIVSSELFTNFSAIYTDYTFATTLEEFNRQDSTTNYFKSVSGIRDFVARGEAQYFPHEDHSIKTGLELTFHRFRADVSTDLRDFALFEQAPSIINSFDVSLYAQDEWKITPLLSSNLGARMYYFEKGKYLRFEPRLSLAYNLTADVLLKTAFATGNQFLHLITRNDISLPTDVWFPSTATVKPSESMQGVLGFETTVFDKEYLFSVEGYYKTMKNLLEYRDTASFSLSIPLESAFAVGNGEAYGVEFFLNKQIGALTGWIGYTLSWTKRTFPELNHGKTFYPRYDRRHDVSVVLTYRIGDSWKFGAAWTYGSGQSYTIPTGNYYFNDPGDDHSYYYDQGQYDYYERNNHRLPASHRLDLNFTNEFTWFSLPWEFSINIYNAYANRNIFAQIFKSYRYDYTGYTSTRIDRPTFEEIALFPFIPTFGLGVKF